LAFWLFPASHRKKNTLLLPELQQLKAKAAASVETLAANCLKGHSMPMISTTVRKDFQPKKTAI
jgi:hypothetical protein